MESDSAKVQVKFGNTEDVLDFSSFQDVQDWIIKEQEAWRWLINFQQMLSGQERHAHDRLSSFFISVENDLNNAKATGAPLAVVSSFFGTQAQSVVLSTSINGIKILDIAQSLGPQAGASAYALAAGYFNLGEVRNEDQLKGVVEYCFPKSADVANVRDRLATERQNFARTLRTVLNSVSEQELERQKRDDDWLKTRDERLIELVQGLWTTWEARADAWSNRMDNRENSILNVEKQFKEFMELKAPVEYWNVQAQKHRNSSRIFAGGLALYFLLAILGLKEAYFSVGEGLFKSISDADNVGKNILLYYATGGLLVLTTLVFWIGRILSRMYLSEQHLSTDATQRAVMTMTYLALIPQSSDDKNSREIILNALFRATSDGVVKDEGGDTNLAMLLSRMNLPK